MPKRKVATWYMVGRIFYVRPPDWPRQCELSFTDQGLMVNWAHDNSYVLKDTNVRRRGNDGRNQARSARHDLAVV